jgi:hypothetical protein
MRIKTVLEWKESRPQFDFYGGDAGYSVKRIKDDQNFYVGYCYLFDDGKERFQGVDAHFFYIVCFHSDRINLNFRITKGGDNPVQEGVCEINSLKLEDHGVLKIISFER